MDAELNHISDTTKQTLINLVNEGAIRLLKENLNLPPLPPRHGIRKYVNLCWLFGHGNYFSGWLGDKVCGWCYKTMYNLSDMCIGRTIIIKKPVRFKDVVGC